MTQPFPSPTHASSQPACRRITVRRVDTLTTLMRRITFDTHGIDPLPITRPAQAIKLFVPGPLGEAVGRAYTIRAYRPDEHAMEIDFLLHGHGPAAAWAARALPGDTLEFTGPKSGFQLAPATDWLLLIGDACALPAIGAILESLPAGFPVRAIIAVRDAGEQQALRVGSTAQVLNWVYSNASSTATLAALIQALENSPAQKGTGQVFLAAESAVVRALRTRFPQAPDLGAGFAGIQAMGYWKQGRTDYHDHQ